MTAEPDRVLRNFLGEDGRLQTIPSKHSREDGLYWRSGGTFDV